MNREILATMPNAVLRQHENAAWTYYVNWAPVMGTDTIASSTWTDETSGLTIANEATSDPKTSARLSGNPGRYLITNKVTFTTSGDTAEQQFILIITDNDRRWINDYQNLWIYS